MKSSKDLDLLSIGAVYLDIDCFGVPYCHQLHFEEEILGRQYRLSAGGSAVRCAEACRAMGLECMVMGKIGHDGASHILEELFTRSRLPFGGLIRSRNVQTNLGLNIVREKDGHAVMVVLGTANQSLAYSELKQLPHLLRRTRVLYLGGVSNLKALAPDLPRIAQMAKVSGCLVAVDHGRLTPSFPDWQGNAIKETLAHADLYFPSTEEILGLFSAQRIDLALEQALDLGARIICLKEGKHGCRVKDTQFEHHQPPIQVPVVSTVGAGDVFNAAFIFAYLEGVSLVRCARIASSAAAFWIEKGELPSSVMKIERPGQ